MTLYSDPPPLRSFYQDKPTLLVCWWITAFCTVIILLRVAGRYIRTERLFREDRVAGIALVPMYLRMGCVHVILLYGTNNAQIEGAGLSDEELHQKSIASGLVLASRIFYAATYVAQTVFCRAPLLLQLALPLHVLDMSRVSAAQRVMALIRLFPAGCGR